MCFLRSRAGQVSRALRNTEVGIRFAGGWQVCPHERIWAHMAQGMRPVLQHLCPLVVPSGLGRFLLGRLRRGRLRLHGHDRERVFWVLHRNKVDHLLDVFHLLWGCLARWIPHGQRMSTHLPTSASMSRARHMWRRACHTAWPTHVHPPAPAACAC